MHVYVYTDDKQGRTSHLEYLFSFLCLPISQHKNRKRIHCKQNKKIFLSLYLNFESQPFSNEIEFKELTSRFYI